ncbi:MAG: glycosyltransferase [Acidimicrobiaceae bacterium]|nr:glycosyltransferase [Ilumatobacter sp.]MCB9382448.1 glycosyltransferase [Acidimicrobiaceae bacterium]MCO5329756.1 glycosyltransferase [Ilumatobacteraceae bacterium]
MTTVSFIVPTKNAERTIAACVRSLRGQHLEPGVCDRVEVVLVDNHSTDRTVELATPYVDHVEIAGPERCAQRNLGAARSAGDVVVFVDADMVLEPTIAVESARAIAHGDLDLLVLPELAFGESFFAECRSLEKRLYLGDASVEAGRAIRHTLFDTVGGWDETLTAGEDWDLTDRLRQAGARVGRTAGHVWHDEGHVHLLTQFRKKRYYGKWVAEYLRRDGASRHLARTSLFSRPRMLLAEPRHAAGLMILKAVEAAGLATGMAGAWRTRTVS